MLHGQTNINSATCLGCYVGIIGLTTKTNRRYSQLLGFGISKPSGILFYEYKLYRHAALGTKFKNLVKLCLNKFVK